MRFDRDTRKHIMADRVTGSRDRALLPLQGPIAKKWRARKEG